MPVGGIYDPDFAPPPSPIAWNGDYVGSHAYWNRLDVGQSAYMFWQAIRERCFASNVRTFVIGGVGGNKAPAAALPGDKPIATDAHSYESIRSLMVDQSLFYVRSVQDDGASLYVHEGRLVIDSAARHYDEATHSSMDLVFPLPNKFSRRFHRNIFSLSNAGPNGERARFVAFFPFSGESFYGVRTTDPFFGSAPVTPSGEYVNDGKIFDRVAGVWVLSADQMSDPTIIEENAVSQMYRGDLHDAKHANELRDAMNQLTRTIGYSTVIGTGGATPAVLVPTPSFDGSLDESGLDPNKTRTSGTDTVSAAHADAAYSAAGTVLDGTQAFSQKVTSHWVFGDGLPHQWNVSTGQTQFKVPSHPTLPAMPNPLAQARNIHYYIITWALSEWDTQGISDLVQDTWHEFGPSVPDSFATSITGPQIGDVTTHPPNWPVATPDGQRGWSLQYACMILDWERPSGFQFSKVST